MATYIRKNLTPLWYVKENEKRTLKKIKRYLVILIVINVVLCPITISKRKAYKSTVSNGNINTPREEISRSKTNDYDFVLGNKDFNIINFDFQGEENYITMYFESINEGDETIKVMENYLEKEVLINMQKNENGYIYKITF